MILLQTKRTMLIFVTLKMSVWKILESKYPLNKETRHNAHAKYWAIGVIILGSAGLSTIWFSFGAFWSGYVLDMTGPAWNYILFRGLYTTYSENSWTRFFTPQKTIVIFLLICFGIETMQYFNVYDSTFDPWDFLAYISILLPLFLLDMRFSKNEVGSRIKNRWLHQCK